MGIVEYYTRRIRSIQTFFETNAVIEEFDEEVKYEYAKLDLEFCFRKYYLNPLNDYLCFSQRRQIASHLIYDKTKMLLMFYFSVVSSDRIPNDIQMKMNHIKLKKHSWNLSLNQYSLIC